MANETLNGFLLPAGTYEEKAVPPGEWRAFDGFTFLAGIADRLDVRNVQSEMDDIISIPDLWAQVAGFAGALAAPRHPRHDTTVAEWRGLVALLALGQVRGWSLEFQTLTIDDGATLQDGAFLPFGAVASQQCPSHKVVGDMDWRRLVLVRLDRKPVALLNPWTLLCPVRDHLIALPATLPWMMSGHPVDPASGEHLGKHDLELLTEYCGRIAGKLSQQARTAPAVVDIDLVNLLAAKFNEFKETIRRAAMNRQLGDLEILSGDPVAYPGTQGLPHWLYREIASTGDTGGGAEGSDILVPCRESFGAKLTGALLIDPSLSGTFDMPTTAIKAWRNHSLASMLNPSQALRDKVAAEMTEARVEMITPDHLFTPFLLKMRDGALKGHSSDTRGFVLPVTPLLLLFLTPEEIRQNLTIRQAGSGFEVVLRIRVETWGASGNKVARQHELKRVYDGEKVVEAVRPAALSLWPNFAHPEWRRYFVLNSYDRTGGGRPLRAHALVTARSLAAALAESGLDNLTEPLAAPPKLNLGPSIDLLCADGTVEAVICDVPSPTVGADPNSWAIGGLLMFGYSNARPPVGIGASFQVGIDFGTTNTAVYARVNQGTPKPLSFANRFIHALDGDSSMADHLLATHLCPAKDISSPFLTALLARGREDSNQVRPLLTDHIWFGQDSLRHQLDALRQDSPRSGGKLHYDIKWGQMSGERRLVEAFLSQVVLMAAAEAIDHGADFRSVQWKFSYPEAFSDSHKAAFEGSVRRAIHNALDIQPKDRDLRPVPESFASAMYFLSTAKAYFSDTVIAIDMGGKTADISIWQGGRAVWQNSLKFAGRNLLVHYLAHNPSVFKLLDGPVPGQADHGKIGQLACEMIEAELEPGEKSISPRIIHIIETMINHPWYSHGFAHNYPIIAGEPLMAKLRMLAVLGLSGLLHYVGQVAKHLCATGALHPNDHAVTLCMGGRGSLLFKSYFGEASRIQPFSPLANIFHRVSGLQETPQNIAFSQLPKSEVAHGLLVDPPPYMELGTDASRVLPLGAEVILSDGTVCPATVLLGDLPVGLSWKMGDLDVFTAFLRDVQQECRCVLPLSLLADQKFTGEVGTGLANARGNAREKGGDHGSDRPEPPFIIQLRTFVEMIAKDPDLIIREE